MYGSAVEDVYTGLVLHSRGCNNSIFCSPERKAILGLAPVNTNDTLIQHRRWSTGLLEIFLSDYCNLFGDGKLKLGQIMCYSFYTLWALWCFPMLVYAVVPPLAVVNGISLFQKVVSADKLTDGEECNDIVEDMRERGAKFGIQTFCVAYCIFKLLSLCLSTVDVMVKLLREQS